MKIQVANQDMMNFGLKEIFYFKYVGGFQNLLSKLFVRCVGIVPCTSGQVLYQANPLGKTNLLLFS